MRDIPFFTTDNGVAGLVLRDIPYTGNAFITVQQAASLEDLLAECADFARMAGAAVVYASGTAPMDAYPIYTHIYKMTANLQNLPETDACVFPVTEETLEKFRSFYNEKMEAVPLAAYCSKEDAEELLKKRNAYFVHREDNLLGIVIAAGDKLDAIASNIPGAGRDLVGAARKILTEETVHLEVASENTRALKLYEGLGFLRTGVIKTWYKIF